MRRTKGVFVDLLAAYITVLQPVSLSCSLYRCLAAYIAVSCPCVRLCVCVYVCVCATLCVRV